MNESGLLRSVGVAADDSVGLEHLIARGTSRLGEAVFKVADTADGYLAVWRRPSIWVGPLQPTLPGAYVGVALDTDGAATSLPRGLGHARGLLSPRPVGGYTAIVPSADGDGFDIELLSPRGVATSARAPLVRSRRFLAMPEATLHRPDGQSTVLWRVVREFGLDMVRGTWMRRVSASGQPIGRPVRLLPALAPGLQRGRQAAMDADGTLALAWTEQPRMQPMLRTFTATGIPLGPAVAIADGPGAIHGLAFGAGGDVLVLWQSMLGEWPGPSIEATLFSRQGDPRGGAELPSSASAGYPRMVCADVAATGAGPTGESWLVSWLAASATQPIDLRLLARRFAFD